MESRKAPNDQVNQSKNLSQANVLTENFLKIKNTAVKIDIINLVKNFANMEPQNNENDLLNNVTEENAVYIKKFTECINQIDSIAIKDLIMEYIQSYIK